MICRALGEGAAIHATCKDWYKRPREGGVFSRRETTRLTSKISRPALRNRSGGSKLGSNGGGTALRLETETLFIHVTAISQEFPEAILAHRLQTSEYPLRLPPLSVSTSSP